MLSATAHDRKTITNRRAWAEAESPALMRTPRLSEPHNRASAVSGIHFCLSSFIAQKTCSNIPAAAAAAAITIASKVTGLSKPYFGS